MGFRESEEKVFILFVCHNIGTASLSTNDKLVRELSVDKVLLKIW